MSVGENVRRLREQRDMTQTELARLANVSGPMITQIERGTKSPSLQLGKEIATVLRCSLEDLLASTGRGESGHE